MLEGALVAPSREARCGRRQAGWNKGEKSWALSARRRRRAAQQGRLERRRRLPSVDQNPPLCDQLLPAASTPAALALARRWRIVPATSRSIRRGQSSWDCEARSLALVCVLRILTACCFLFLGRRRKRCRVAIEPLRRFCCAQTLALSVATDAVSWNFRS